MIQNSFLFLERVNKGLERNLWKNGIRDWDAFLSSPKIRGLSTLRKRYYDRKILEARSALYSGNSSYFWDILPQSEHYRLYEHFRDEAVFLDIETTGFDRYANEMTMIGLYDGIATKMMIKGINLDYQGLKRELSRYKLLVTFNGSSFDIPFLEKQYPGIIPKVPHFDVLHLSKRVGFSGGLKLIEKMLGMTRPKLVDDLDGGDALLLWKMYRVTGDEHYLNILIEYNECDVVNLKKVAEHCLAKLKDAIPPAAKQAPLLLPREGG